MLTELETVSRPGEEWRVVESKCVKWYVSSHARVYVEGQECTYTRTRLGVTHTAIQKRKGGILSPCKARNGYLEIARKISGGQRVKERLHRLVALAFCQGHEPGLTVNHIDGDKTNNLPENLEWISLAENTRHQWGTGLAKGSEPKLTSKQIVYMRRLYRQGIPGHTIDIIAGCSPGYTQKICAGERRQSVLG